MPSTEKLDTHRKALTLNLDTSKFGSFAKIGAGQEVARWFLAAGGASVTVAKMTSQRPPKNAAAHRKWAGRQHCPHSGRPATASFACS
jgi:hypothetical protein